MAHTIFFAAAGGGIISLEMRSAVSATVKARDTTYSAAVNGGLWVLELFNWGNDGDGLLKEWSEEKK